ncbi:MAG: histidinol-phosphatase [Candidatus Zixiibacteriota bacterium]
MQDFHIHPAYSIDARGNAEDFVKAAIEKKIKRICFTTHIDLNPARAVIDLWAAPDGYPVPLSKEIMQRYASEIGTLKKKYAHEIEILKGYEFSYAPDYEDLIESFINKFPADFMIGSIHCIDDVGFTAGFEASSVLRLYEPLEFMEIYSTRIISLARSGLFDTIGHIDGYKKYAKRNWNMEELREAEETVYPGLFDRLSEIGAGIEINTSAMRKGFDEFYPSSKILKLAKDKGVMINSIGSDAHRANQVGFKFKDAMELLDELGIELRI